MNKVNEFFVNIADKIPFGKDFFKNSLPIFGIEINNLFLILVSLLLVVVAVILIIVIAASSKKAKSVSSQTEGDEVAQSSADSTACGAVSQPKCAAAAEAADNVKQIDAEAEKSKEREVKAASEDSDTVKPQSTSVLSDSQDLTEIAGSKSDAVDTEKIAKEQDKTQTEPDAASLSEAETTAFTQENKDEDLSKLVAATVSEAAKKTKPASNNAAAKAKSEKAPAAEGAKKPIKKAEPEQKAAQPIVAAAPAKQSEPKDVKNVASAAPKKSDNATGKKSADNRYSGKYEVNLTVCGYRFFLVASNGQLLYESNGYTSADGALKGIETFKNAVPNGVFVVDEDKFNRFRYILNKRYVGENYTTKPSCENSIESVKKFSQTAVITPYVMDEAAEQAYAESLKERKAQKEVDWAEIEEAEKLVKPSGKFEITKAADGFHFNLIANNGQLLYASNGYASNKSANEGIKNFKKTVYTGNFFVDEDKFGRFRYILRGATFNSTYIGESYTARAACEKIIQSVKKFVKSAVMPE